MADRELRSHSDGESIRLFCTRSTDNISSHITVVPDGVEPIIRMQITFQKEHDSFFHAWKHAYETNDLQHFQWLFDGAQEALAKLNESFVHFDVKAENFVIMNEATPSAQIVPRVALIDLAGMERKGQSFSPGTW